MTVRYCNIIQILSFDIKLWPIPFLYNLYMARLAWHEPKPHVRACVTSQGRQSTKSKVMT